MTSNTRPVDAFRRGARFGSRAIDLSAELSRKEARRRAAMFRQKATFILQCSAAAAVAYAVARYVFDVAVPLFAPVAAMIALGMTHGQRLKRAVEITVGVAVGVAIGESFVHAFGLGVWQVAAIVALAMSAASLVGAGALMVTQAGVQGLIVALLSADPTHAFGRWFEALIGSTVAMLFAAIVPTSLVFRPREKATAILHTLSDLLSRTAVALDERDVAAIDRTLADARATESDMVALRGVTTDALDVLRVSPFQRARIGEVREVAGLIEPVDRAVRNARVLIRRASVSLSVRDDVPTAYADAVQHLAEATESMAGWIETGAEPPELRAGLMAIARETADAAPDASLSAEVVRAQVRSLLVDLLMALGDAYADAVAAVRAAGTG
ncbi:MAG: FUSC family protein [Dermatophilaceae bacterium]